MFLGIVRALNPGQEKLVKRAQGSFLHAARLTEDQVDALLDTAEEYPGKTENP